MPKRLSGKRLVKGMVVAREHPICPGDWEVFVVAGRESVSVCTRPRREVAKTVAAIRRLLAVVVNAALKEVR